MSGQVPLRSDEPCSCRGIHGLILKCQRCGSLHRNQENASPTIEATPLTVDQADNLRRGLPLDLTPRLMDLQARVQELEHLAFMSLIGFELILQHPDTPHKVARKAIARLERSGIDRIDRWKEFSL